MKIEEARNITGAEKCDFDTYGDECPCGKKQNKYNAENYIRTSYNGNDGDYYCNFCLKLYAKFLQKEEENV